MSLFDEDASLDACNSDEVANVDHLLRRTHSYRRSREFLEMLRFIRRLKQYKPFNGFLLHVQDPTATYVATETHWGHAYGRTVSPEARPLVVLVPFGPVAFVYDMRDTAGPPLPESVFDPFPAHGDVPPKALENLEAHAREAGILVHREPMPSNQGGFARQAIQGTIGLFPLDPAERSQFEVVVNSEETAPVALVSLLHELGHVMCGHLGARRGKPTIEDRSSLRPEVKEFEAEVIAYLASGRLGVHSKSEQYLAWYAGTYPEIPPISLDTVLRTAGRIIGWAVEPPAKTSPQPALFQPHGPRPY